MFKIDTAEDLLCRGFSPEYILEKTGVDVGYNGVNLRTQLSGVDRKKYKIDYIKKHVGSQDWEKALDLYSSGASKEDILNFFGISGVNIITLDYIFKNLGLKNAYKEANESRKTLQLQVAKASQLKNKKTTKTKTIHSTEVTSLDSTKINSTNDLAYTHVTKKEVESRIYYDNGNFPTKYYAKEVGMHDAVKNMLIDTFGENGFIENYSDERYPLGAKFYIPSKDMFIEYFLETKKKSYHWYNPKNFLDGSVKSIAGLIPTENEKTDFLLAQEWKESKNEQDNLDFIEWTQIMTKKRKHAKKNKLNYIVYWSNVGYDAFTHFDLGYPDGQDWLKEFSWIPYRKITNPHYPIPGHLGKGSGTNVAIEKYFQSKVFYENDMLVWNLNEPSKIGRTQGELFCNRRFYIGKRYYELTDAEVLRGLNISRKTVAYSSFYNTGFTYVLEKYSVKSVADFSAGWGARMSTCAAYGIPYYGVDINKKLEPGYKKMIKHFNLVDQHFIVGDSVKTPLKDYNADAVISCPAYFSREVYSNEPGAADSMASYDDFLENWWKPTIDMAVGKDTRIFAFQIHEFYEDKFTGEKYTIASDMMKILEEKGWKFIDSCVVSQGRVSHMNRGKGGVVKKENFEHMWIFERKTDDVA